MPDESWETYSPDSSYIAYAKNHNIYIMQANDPDSTGSDSVKTEWKAMVEANTELA